VTAPDEGLRWGVESIHYGRSRSSARSSLRLAPDSRREFFAWGYLSKAFRGLDLAFESIVCSPRFNGNVNEPPASTIAAMS
jgi:hypothetical protein